MKKEGKLRVDATPTVQATLRSPEPELAISRPSELRSTVYREACKESDAPCEGSQLLLAYASIGLLSQNAPAGRFTEGASLLNFTTEEIHGRRADRT